MNKAYLLLGSNDGDRVKLLKEALLLIEQNCGNIEKRSQIYQTAAWGLEDQPDFLNTAILVNTNLTPLQLLDQIHAIEEQLGRQRSVVWGQRTLDIDILLYNTDVIQTSNLHIPHPHLPNRRFALAPLNEIEPAYTHPILGKTINMLLQECADPLPVRLYLENT